MGEFIAFTHSRKHFYAFFSILVSEKIENIYIHRLLTKFGYIMMYFIYKQVGSHLRHYCVKVKGSENKKVVN